MKLFIFIFKNDQVIYSSGTYSNEGANLNVIYYNNDGEGGERKGLTQLNINDITGQQIIKTICTIKEKINANKHVQFVFPMLRVSTFY